MKTSDLYLVKFSDEDSGLTPVNSILSSFFKPVTSRRSSGSQSNSSEPASSSTVVLVDISHSDLVNIKSDDHHSRYTDAEVVSTVNNDLNHGSNAIHKPSDLKQEGASDGQAIVWNASTSKYEPQVAYSDENAQDAVGNILSTDAAEEIIFNYNDSENKITATGGIIDFGGF